MGDDDVGRFSHRDLRLVALKGKLALIKQQRYAHAKQVKRANKCLKTLKTYLGRVRRDILRKIDGDTALKAVFE